LGDGFTSVRIKRWIGKVLAKAAKSVMMTAAFLSPSIYYMLGVYETSFVGSWPNI
jgi:hypothetical protein